MSSSSAWPWSLSAWALERMWEDLAIPAHIPAQMSPWLQDLLWALTVALQQPLSCLSAVCVQRTPGGSCAKETCSYVLWLIDILFPTSLGHQRTSILTLPVAADTCPPFSLQPLSALQTSKLSPLSHHESQSPFLDNALSSSFHPIAQAPYYCMRNNQFLWQSILLSLSFLVG